jgi:glycosyltransferase involved in cell wall biosynthesis
MPESPVPQAGSRATVSVVIEWENALNSEAGRAVDMLRQVAKQIDGYYESHPTTTFEILVVYDSEAFIERDLSDFIGSALGQFGRRHNWRLLDLPGGGYYASKDHGARQASSDIVLFIDSDAVPGEGWLNALMEGINMPDVNLLIGTTYIDYRDLLGKTFALNWFFPLRSGGGPPARARGLIVSNMAVRRKFYLEHPFPEIPGTSRGSCVVLGNRLADSQIPVYVAPDALASHPAPNGMRHLVPRALAQGRDRVIRERYLGNRWQQSWLSGCIRLLRHLLGSVWKTISGRSGVGLSLRQVPAAIAIAWFYYFLYWLGETGEHFGLKRLRAIRV